LPPHAHPQLGGRASRHRKPYEPKASPLHLYSLSAMTEVPLIRVFTGKKKGTIASKPWAYELCLVAMGIITGPWRAKLKIENFSGWPMLAGQGIQKGTADEIQIGPNTVLYAPPTDGSGGSKWEILGPDAALVEQIGKGPERVYDTFSKLALQPTIPKARVTATATGVDNSRAHSAIEAWSGNLKNGLDEGLHRAMARHRRHPYGKRLDGLCSAHRPAAPMRQRSSATRRSAASSLRKPNAPNSSGAAFLAPISRKRTKNSDSLKSSKD
jgi:hypothetical protein